VRLDRPVPRPGDTCTQGSSLTAAGVYEGVPFRSQDGTADRLPGASDPDYLETLRGDAPALLRAALAANSPTADGEAALQALLPLVYRRLRDIAGSYLARERRGHTLSPTALVHEAYLRLLEQPGVSWRGGNHVVALAAHMMRRVLVNHAVARQRKKRGQGWQRVTIDTGLEVPGKPAESQALDLIEIDDLLRQLAVLDPRQARVVELRFFGGMTVDEIAATLEISPATAKREWATARLWLLRELRGG
jgi:RNA polymerase sigma-70 factor, ECF subfamily